MGKNVFDCRHISDTNAGEESALDGAERAAAEPKRLCLVHSSIPHSSRS